MSTSELFNCKKSGDQLDPNFSAKPEDQCVVDTVRYGVARACRIRVNFELRYGTCGLLSARAEITCRQQRRTSGQGVIYSL
eukprot:6205185-Pleurochrysis_carterae.AAC.11